MNQALYAHMNNQRKRKKKEGHVISARSAGVNLRTALQMLGHVFSFL
jgi:hypothetical protein